MRFAETDPAADFDRSARPLYPVSRIHLDAMTSEIGVWQHARGSRPDPRFGYCTDDIGRALVVDSLQARELGWPAVDASVKRSLRYLTAAFVPASGRFLNLRAADGHWLEADASQDSHARALGGLAAIVVASPDADLADDALHLFLAALPAAESFDAIRAVSGVLLACESIASSRPSPRLEAALDLLSAKLEWEFGEPSADWQWPEPLLAYENSIVPRGLIAAGVHLRKQELVDRGCAVLDWLIDVQTEAGHFSPIGNEAWWRRNGQRSTFDQQPIEAEALIGAATDALRITGEPRYRAAAESAYAWFLGDNDLSVPLADPARGSCHDGLTRGGRNTNQGAESTLMWLMALEQMRELRVASPSSAGGSHE